jgi:hypothetical protein
MASMDPSGGCRVEMVRLSRNGGDDPVRCEVSADALRNPHVRDQRGGDYAALDAPTLAAYVDSELVPEFVRSGRHGRGSLVALIEPHDNDPAVYEGLRQLAAAFQPSPRYLRQRAAAAIQEGC